MSLQKLLEPGNIGGLELPNRLVFAPIATRAAEPAGMLGSVLADFYEERAKGGPGLMIMGHTFCWPEENTGGNMGLWSNDHIPALAELARKVHGYNVKLAVQLGGRGTRRADGKSMAPSAVRFAFEKGIPREITVEELAYFVEHYGKAARRAREAGLDAVEVHAAHGKLVSLFLSPYSNRRTDAYGGTLEKRTLFARQILTAIRKEAGQDFPVIFRLSADDMLEGGNTPEEGVRIAKILADAGADAFEVSAGNQERGWNTSFSYFFPRACLAHLARPVGEGTGKPVIAVAKINDPMQAEQLLQDGKADFVSMGRPFITDPQILVKAREGRSKEIRRCIYCLNCFTFASRKERITTPGITCTVNPEVLRERSFLPLVPAETPRRVLVVGGGLAGMEAARTLAMRGHKVDLYEASKELGGQWLVASKADYKADFRTLVPHMILGLHMAGVRIHTGTRCTANCIRAQKPDAVVLATGAVPRQLAVPRPDRGGPKVVQGMDVIMDKASTGPRVVVVGGRYIGMEVAVKLAKAGRHVSLVEAEELGHGTIDRLLGIYRNMLVEHNVHIYARSPLMRLTTTGVDVVNNGSLLSLPADTVVLAVGTVPVNDLAPELDAIGVEWHAAGDCGRMGDALHAIRDGAEIGRKI